MMRLQLRFLLKIALTTTLLLGITYAMAAPTVTLKATPGVCASDGRIEVNATGLTGSTILYALKKESDESFSSVQESNIFNNLPSGRYIAAVYDETEIPLISNVIVLTNKPYTDVSAVTIAPGNSLVTGCDEDGSIAITISGGNAPYTYQLRGGPTVRDYVDVFSTSVKFEQLATGTYHIDITDNCGNISTLQDISVVSKYNLSGVDLGSFELSGATFTSSGCDLIMNFPAANILLRDVGGNVIFQRGGVQVPGGYSGQMRVEYPSGSGQYTDWFTPGTLMTIPAAKYQPANNKYKVQFRNPCNASDIVTTSEYSISLPYVSLSGYCAPSVIRNLVGYNCGEVKIKLTKADNSTITRDFTWDGNGTSFPLDMSALATGSYTVQITVKGVTYLTGNVSTTTTAPAAPNMAFIYNYPTNLGCDFTTGGFRSYGIKADNTVPITYSIVSGPVTRDPVTATQDKSPLWNDLPSGVYTIKFQFGECGTVSRTYTLQNPFSGFNADEVSYIPGSSCGKYKIVGKGWYLDPNGVPSTRTDTYTAAILTVNDKVVNKEARAVVANNTPFTISTYEVGPGTYKIGFVNELHSQGVCFYTYKYITIPPYQPVLVDVPNSGGVACSVGQGGVLHIATIGGSGQNLQYSIKPMGAPDSDYTPFQSSPDFPDKAVGVYTVRVNDVCGYIATGEVTMVATKTLTSIAVTGAVYSAEDRQAWACEGSTVTLRLSIIGISSNEVWTNSQGVDVVGKTYTVNQFSAADAGKYYVNYESGGCFRTDSIVFFAKPRPSLTSTLTPDTICSGSSFVYTPASSIPGSTLTWTRAAIPGIQQPASSGTDGVNEILTNTSPNVINVVYRYKTAYDGCDSTQSVVVSVRPVSTPDVINANSITVCTGTKATLHAQLTTPGRVINPVYRWYTGQNTVSPEFTGADFETNTLTSVSTKDTIFYVTVSGDNYCENLPGNRKAVRVTIQKMPEVKIQTQQNLSLCYNASIALNAVATGNINWYGWYDSKGLANNTTEYSPDTHSPSVVYNPNPADAGTDIKLLVRAYDLVCGYVADSIYLRINPNPTTATFDLEAQPMDFQQLCTDTVYEMKVKASDLGDLTNMKVTLHDINATGVAIKKAELKQPYNASSWALLNDVTSNLTGTSWKLPDNLVSGDSLKVRVTVAAECNFFSGSSIEFNLNAMTTCGDSLPEITKISAPFYTVLDDQQLNDYIVSGSFSLDKVTNNTSDTVTWHMKAIVHTNTATDPEKESLQVLIPAGLNVVPDSYIPIKNAPARSELSFNTDEFGTKFSIPITLGVLDGDSIVAELKFTTKGSPCKTYNFYSEVVYSDSIDCGGSLCEFNSTRGGAYPVLPVERYTFSFADTIKGITADGLWNGSIPLKAGTQFFAGDSIYVDFYVDRDADSQVSPADTLVRTFNYITKNVAVQDTFIVAFDSVHVDVEKQLLARFRGDALCSPVLLPLAVLNGTDFLCQSDTALYYTTAGMQTYKWLVINPDGVSGATPRRIPLENSTVENYVNENVARVVWRKEGNYKIWASYTTSTTPPQILARTYFDVQINQRPVLRLTAGADTTICEGSRIELSHFFRDTVGVGTMSFYQKEINGDYTLISSGSPFYVEPADTTFYKVTAISAQSGCESVNELLFAVNVNKMPRIGSVSVYDQPECGLSNGAIKVAVSGGSGSYEYNLDGGTVYTTLPADGVIANLPVGNYHVYVRDMVQGNCFASISEPINLSAGNNDIHMVVQTTNATDCSTTNGTIRLAVIGGTAPYQYKIGTNSYVNLPANGILGNNFPAGIYNIYVKDATGCETTSGEVIIKATNGLSMDLSQITAAGCKTNGTVQIEVSGGVPDYSYRVSGRSWMPMIADPDTMMLGAGLYEIYAKDSNGCMTSDTIRVDNAESDLLIELLDVVDAPCDGVGSGSAHLKISGSAAPLTYSIDGGKTNVTVASGDITIPGLSVGIYQIQLTDNNGCTTSLDGIEIGRDIEFVQAVNNKVFTYKDQSVESYLIYDDYDYQRFDLRLESVGIPLHGTITVNESGHFSYTPNAGFIGKDSVIYTVTNQCNFAKSAWLFVYVLDPEVTGNHAPSALDDSYTTKIQQPLSNLEVRRNDIDVDGDVLSFPSTIRGTSNGVLLQNPDGTYNYTPNPNFVGVDIFMYSVCDGGGLCDTAQVAISVLAADIYDQYVVALPDVYSIAKFDTLKVANPVDGILDNDRYPSGETPHITIIDGPHHGELIVNPLDDGRFIYIPDLYYSGTDVFRYLLCTDGLTKCDTTWVNIYVAEREILTAVVSGDTVICNGGNADLTITLTGHAPWNFSYQLNQEPVQTVSAYPNNIYTIDLDGLTAASTVKILTLSDAQESSGRILKDTASVKVFSALDREYIVGDVPGADFATLKEASIIYNNCGIIADASLKVSSNIIEQDSVEFLGSAPGSLLHTLTITSDGTRRIVRGHLDNAPLICFTAANNITIEGIEAARTYNIYEETGGNRLVFVNTSTLAPVALDIRKDISDNRGENIYVRNASFATGTKEGGSFGVKVTTDSVTVEGCYVYNATTGMYAGGVISGIFDHNLVRDVKNAGIFVVANATSADGDFMVSNNDVRGVGDTGTEAVGIHMDGMGKVWSNLVSNVAALTAYGIRTQSGLIPVMGEYLLVANNMVSEIKAASAYGIYMDGSMSLQHVLQNTVSLSDNGTGTQTVGIGFKALAGCDFQLRNNILVNMEMTGTGFLYESDTASVVLPVFSNNIYNPYSGNIGILDEQVYNDLTAWNTATGDNSKLLSPSLVSGVDLHLTGASLTDNELRAPFLAGIVETDFDEEVRSRCSNFAGADANPVFVSRYTTIWQPQDESTNWADESNWSNKMPEACANVIIPDGLKSYPVLNQTMSAVCDTIYFEFGGEVAKTHFLDYNFAKADLRLAANRWYFLSPAFQQTYSGDYLSDLSYARINPEIFIMYYQMDNPQTGDQKAATKFSGLFNNTDERLELCSGHAIWVDNGTWAPTDTFDIHYPKDSAYYYYYNTLNVPVKRSNEMKRDSIGRFIYEGSPSYQYHQDGSFMKTIPNSNQAGFDKLIIGNPFMSHLDIVKFQDVNKDYLKKTFYIWGGEASYEAYTIDNDGHVISTNGLGENGILIAPMQSFIIDREVQFTDSLTFSPDMSVTQPGKRLRASQSRLASDVLRLDVLKNGVRQSGMALHYREGAGVSYKKDKDAYTVFPRSFGSYVSLYSVVDTSALSIYTTGDLTRPIDLGIAVGKTIKKDITSGKRSEYLIQIAGEESRLAGRDVYLYDAQTNMKHKLTDAPYVFENTTGDINGRFKLYLSESTTALEDLTGQDIQILVNDGHLIVKSTSGTPLQEVTIYGLQGQVLYKGQDIKSSEFTWPVRQYGLTQMIVKVGTETNNRIKKVVSD